jgi:hypothetical protein
VFAEFDRPYPYVKSKRNCLAECEAKQNEAKDSKLERRGDANNRALRQVWTTQIGEIYRYGFTFAYTMWYLTLPQRCKSHARTISSRLLELMGCH